MLSCTYSWCHPWKYCVYWQLITYDSFSSKIFLLGILYNIILHTHMPFVSNSMWLCELHSTRVLWNFSGQNTELLLLPNPGIFLNPSIKSVSLHLLHCRWIFCHYATWKAPLYYVKKYIIDIIIIHNVLYMYNYIPFIISYRYIAAHFQRHNMRSITLKL